MKRATARWTPWIAVLMLVSCSGGETTSAEGPAGSRTVRVHSFPFIGYGPFFIGIEEGLFAAEGIEVELVELPGRQGDALAALARGEIDVYAGLPSVGLFNAIARGVPVRIVADKGFGDPAAGCASYAVLARSPLLAEGRLKSPADLRGLTLSFNEPTVSGWVSSLLLEEGGLAIDDVRVNSIPPINALEAMRSGQIDLCNTTEPYITLAKRDGIGEVWRDFRDVVPSMTWSILAYGPTLLEDDRELGQRFMRAYLRSVQQYGEGKTDRNLDILSRYTRLDDEILREACWPTIRADGRIETALLDRYLAWAVDRGFLDSAPAPADYFDASFLDDARRRADALEPAPAEVGR